MIVKSRYEISIMCDICDDDNRYEAIFHGATASKAKEEIDKANWFIDHDGVTYCPECSPYPSYSLPSIKLDINKNTKERS